MSVVWNTRHNLMLLCAGLLSWGSAHVAFSLPAVNADSVSASSWLLLVEAAIGGVYDSSATFGVRPDATSDFDAAYDKPAPPHPPGNWVQAYFPHEGGNWPALLGDRFAVDIQQPVAPAWVMEVESSLPSGALTLSWDTAGLGAMPAEYKILLEDTAADVAVDMRLQLSYDFTYGGARTFLISVASPSDVSTIAVAPKWNIVSVPRLVEDSSAAALFPSATSPAYRYDGSYETRALLENGVGYWLKFDAQQLIEIRGAGIPSLAVPVRPGWNLVGSLDHPIPAPAGGVIASQFFGYSGHYAPTDTLRPGEGYWVKAATSGVLALGAAAPSADGRGDLPATATALTVTTAAGVSMSVYLVPSTEPPGAFCELPPAPPRGAFDVRFGSDRFVESYDPATAPAGIYWLRIQSPVYPARLDASPPLHDGAVMEGSCDGVAWHPFPMTIAGDGTVAVRRREADALPAAFALEQNYPNPFNPSTAIRYRLPERSSVRLVIATLLGETLLVLVDGTQEGGPHQLALNARDFNLASGVYWYRITGTDLETGRSFTDAKTLILIK